MKAIIIDVSAWEAYWEVFFKEMDIDVCKQGAVKLTNSDLQKKFVYHAQTLKQKMESP